MNCFVAHIAKEDGLSYLLVTGLSGDQLHCLEWDGKKYQVERQFPLASFKPKDSQITRYCDLSSIRYQGLFSFTLGRLTAWPYLKSLFARGLTSVWRRASPSAGLWSRLDCAPTPCGKVRVVFKNIVKLGNPL